MEAVESFLEYIVAGFIQRAWLLLTYIIVMNGMIVIIKPVIKSRESE